MGTIPPLPPASTIHGTIANPRRVIKTSLVVCDDTSEFDRLLEASLAGIQSKTYNHEILDIKYSTNTWGNSTSYTRYSALIIYTTTE